MRLPLFSYLVVALLLVADAAAAQGPGAGRALKRSTRPDTGAVEVGAVSPVNRWFRAGAQLGSKFGGNYDFENDLVASGRMEIETLNWLLPKKVRDSSKFHLPVIANFSKPTAADFQDPDALKESFSKLIETTEGLNASLYLLRRLDTDEEIEKGEQYAQAWWLSAGGKAVGARRLADSSTFTMTSGRFTAGFELSAYDQSDTLRLPATLSVEGVVTAFKKSDYQAVFGTSESALASLEVTAIYPFAGVGLLGQGAFSKKSPLFRFGFLIMKGEEK